MKSLILSASLMTLVLASVSSAAIQPVTGHGEAAYVRWNMPDGPGFESDTSSDLTGVLVISGEAADAMHSQLDNAVVFPGDPNLENLKPAFISRDRCPARIGKHVTCRKIPLFTKNGQALLRGKDGKVVYQTQCDITINDVTRGIFDESK